MIASLSQLTIRKDRNMTAASGCCLRLAHLSRFVLPSGFASVGLNIPGFESTAESTMLHSSWGGENGFLDVASIGLGSPFSYTNRHTASTIEIRANRPRVEQCKMLFKPADEDAGHRTSLPAVVVIGWCHRKIG